MNFEEDGCIYDTVSCDHSCWGCDYGRKECPACGTTTNYPDFECYNCEDILDKMSDMNLGKEVIGICGLIESGKDTVAKVLIEEYGFSRLSYAMVLKDVVAVLFGWDRIRLDGLTKEDRAWRDKPDQWWSARLKRNITPRTALQMIGTDLFRDYFNEDIWVATIEQRINDYDKVVITDARFRNELQLITNMGGSLWRVKRGPDPSWFLIAERYNIATPKQKKQMQDLRLSPESFDIHPSEYSWVGASMNDEIVNDSSIADLEKSVRSLAEEYNFPLIENL